MFEHYWGIHREAPSMNSNSKSNNNDTISDGVFREGHNIFFYEEVNDTSVNTLIHIIYEIIGEDSGIVSNTVKHINLHFDSWGGWVTSMLKFVDVLRILQDSENPKIKVTAVINHMAASAASFMALMCSERIMTKNSTYMIHEILAVETGTYSILASRMSWLERLHNTLVEGYASRSNLSEDDVRDVLRKEKWYTAEEALEAGFVDSIM